MTVLIQAIIIAVVLLVGVWLLAALLGEWGLIIAAALAIGGLFAGLMAVSEPAGARRKETGRAVSAAEGREGENRPEE